MNKRIKLQEASCFSLEMVKRTLLLLLGIGLTVTIPQLFHIAGLHLGAAQRLGERALPMFLTLLLLTSYYKTFDLALIALISPLASSVFIGMPSFTVLPFITIQLTALVAIFKTLTVKYRSKLCKKGYSYKLSSLFFFLLLAQIISTILKVLVAFVAISLLKTSAITIPSILFSTYLSLPGLLLQLLVIPPFVSRAL